MASPESGDNQKAFKIPEESDLGRGGSSARELDRHGHLRRPVFIVIWKAGTRLVAEPIKSSVTQEHAKRASPREERQEGSSSAEPKTQKSRRTFPSENVAAQILIFHDVRQLFAHVGGVNFDRLFLEVRSLEGNLFE